GFVEVTVVGRAVTNERERDRASVVVLRFEGDAGCQRQVTADDGIAAPEVVFTRGKVHGAALTTAYAGRLTHHFSHEWLGVDAARQGDAVVAIGGNDVVFLAERCQRTHTDGFMTAVEVQVYAGNALLFVQVVARVLKFAYQDNLPVPFQQR